MNGAIHCFEIKSNENTLRRLPGQIEIYSRTLETVTLVVGNKHLEQALKVIPKWWGVVVAKEKIWTEPPSHEEKVQIKSLPRPFRGRAAIMEE